MVELPDQAVYERECTSELIDAAESKEQVRCLRESYTDLVDSIHLIPALSIA